MEGGSERSRKVEKLFKFLKARAHPWLFKTIPNRKIFQNKLRLIGFCSFASFLPLTKNYEFDKIMLEP
jgi:hypothetical protein